MCTRCPLHAAGTPHALGALSLSSKSTEPAAMRQQFYSSALSVTQAHQSPAEDEGQLVLRGTAEHTGRTATPPCRLQLARGQNLPIPSSKNFQAQSKTYWDLLKLGAQVAFLRVPVCAHPHNIHRGTPSLSPHSAPGSTVLHHPPAQDQRSAGETYAPQARSTPQAGSTAQAKQHHRCTDDRAVSATAMLPGLCR